MKDHTFLYQLSVALKQKLKNDFCLGQSISHYDDMVETRNYINKTETHFFVRNKALVTDYWKD